jgi:membrane dipeptidase
MGKIDVSSGELAPGIMQLFADNIVWDNHGCMPLRADDETFLPQLERYATCGIDAVTLNIGFDATPWQSALAVLAHFRRWLSVRSDRYIVVSNVADIERAHRERKLAVSFDIEGGAALDERLAMVQLYYELGVRWMLIAYNRNNSLGGGCHDEDDGLTRFGVQVLREMRRVGMVPCCSHTGFRTTMEVMEQADGPVIFSHSNPLGVWRHYRNIRDEAIRACAKTGGVVGINGIGLFLGNNDSRTETLVRHIDYVVQLVGPRHVGLGLDFVFDPQELSDFLKANVEVFPPEEYGCEPRMVAPEQVPEIASALLRLGYADADVCAVMGGNHMRVARQVWK